MNEITETTVKGFLQTFKADIMQAIDQKNEAIEARLYSIEKATARQSREITDIKEDMTITPAEADDIALAVRRKGVEVMGGKKTSAYKNLDIRRSVYRDIYGEMKRQFGLINERGCQLSYKKLRRKFFKPALNEIENYIVSAALDEMITTENDLDDLNDN